MKTVPRDQRFWSHVEKSDGCWVWTGASTGRGYGNFWNGDVLEMAHRYAYRTQIGPIPPGLDVCHRCDNPPCVRGECSVPGCEHTMESVGCQSHLFAGTEAENTADMMRKGRQRLGQSNPLFGEAHQNHRLSSNDVREIRARRLRGETLQAIADSFGTNYGYVGRIVRGEARVHD